MSTVKTQARKIVEKLPESATWQDLIHEIEVRQRIDEGLRDIEEGCTTPHEEVRRRFLGG